MHTCLIWLKSESLIDLQIRTIFWWIYIYLFTYFCVHISEKSTSVTTFLRDLDIVTWIYLNLFQKEFLTQTVKKGKYGFRINTLVIIISEWNSKAKLARRPFDNDLYWPFWKHIKPSTQRKFIYIKNRYTYILK